MLPLSARNGRLRVVPALTNDYTINFMSTDIVNLRATGTGRNREMNGLTSSPININGGGVNRCIFVDQRILRFYCSSLYAVPEKVWHVLSCTHTRTSGKKAEGGEIVSMRVDHSGGALLL